MFSLISFLKNSSRMKRWWPDVAAPSNIQRQFFK